MTDQTAASLRSRRAPRAPFIQENLMNASLLAPLRGTRRRSLLAVSVLLLALAGCTASPTAASDPTAGTVQPSTDAEFSAARDAYDRELAQCFRDQGLSVQDPQPGVGITETSPEIQEAYPVCAAKIGDPPSDANLGIDPAQLEKLLQQATCLRQKGYEIKEPTAADPGFIPAEVTDEDFETCRI